MAHDKAMTKTTMLEDVVLELKIRNGAIRKIADATGVSYDSVLRIKNGKNDPGYSSVATLYAYLFPIDGIFDRKQGAHK